MARRETRLSPVNPDTGMAAWLALTWRARLQPGEAVLVLGANGSLGSIAVQAARALGAGRVVAADRDLERLDRMLARGADTAVVSVTLDDGSSFGERMLIGGYAYEFTYDQPYRAQPGFLAALQDAQTLEQGLWSPTGCNGKRTLSEPAASPVTVQPEETRAAAPAVDPDLTAECAIKGNINREGERIYHLPGPSPSYDDTIIDESAGEQCFCSAEAAEAAGWRAPDNVSAGLPTNVNPSGDLGLAQPMTRPACDGLGIVILKSAITPGIYEAEVQQALDQDPGASYLRTDQACPSHSQATETGDPIYAVYLPAGYTQTEVCAAVANAPAGSYRRWLSTAPDDTREIEC